MAEIRIKVAATEGRPEIALAETLKLAKAFGDSIYITFDTTQIKILVHPDSNLSDLRKIWDLELELYRTNKNL